MWKKVAAVLFVVACVIGFAYQVVKISILYFEYPTSTRLVSRPVSADFFDSPVLTLCSLYQHHLDRSRLQPGRLLPQRVI